MNRNAPDYYVEPSAEASIAATRELIAHIRSLPPAPGTGEALVRPILTPRFALACTDDLLSGLGQLASFDPSLAIQTHISENESEIVFTKKLFPSSLLPDPPAPLRAGSKHKRKGEECTYAGVYDAFGLLRHNTILAHAVHLEDEELESVVDMASRRVGWAAGEVTRASRRAGDSGE